jgi:molecular chaperone HtpG
MKPDQKEIFFLVAPSRETAETSPYFEVFKANGLEVLFAFDPWDELVMDRLHSFDGKPLRAADKADIQLGDTPANPSGLTPDQATALAAWVQETLGSRVQQVRPSRRLLESPALLIDKDPFSATLRRLARTARPDEPPADLSLDLEINTTHPILVRLDALRQSDPALAAQVASQILDNARVAAGLMDDPREMIGRLNQLLENLMLARTQPSP